MQNIARVYADISGTVNFTNLNVENNANMMDGKISNNLNVDGVTTLHNLNVSGNINASGNITTNNKGMVTWRQQIIWGRPQQVQAKDPNGNVYNADEWFIYASGWGVNGIGNCNSYIDSTSNTWFLRVWAIKNPNENYIDVLAIPNGYFSNIFKTTFT